MTETETSMANAEQLSILKRGVKAWNEWRAKNIYVYTDLNEADLNGVDLGGADLRITHLRRANLFRADLSGANLSGADLSDADLREANLGQTDLTKANLNGAKLNSAYGKEANLSQANLLAASLRNANFSHANFSHVNLMVATLSGADLSEVNLSGSNLTKAHLSGVRLLRADLSEATLTRTNLTKSNLLEAKFIKTDLMAAIFLEASVGNTVFANSDLGQVIGLDRLVHRAPSHISTDTFILSEGKLPDAFLRGCGLSDADIEYARLSNPALSVEEINERLTKIRDLREAQAVQISPLFISYSLANSPFVDKIGEKLSKKGIRYWRDMHENQSEGMEHPIDGAIGHDSKVVLILSEHSMQSDWVEQEVKEARTLEKERAHPILFPIALDVSWKDGRVPKRVMETTAEFNILDFSAWRDDQRFEKMFHTLLEKLDLFHKG
jgi:uncharacterized protein YjbI with pentapeptide repeats